MYKNYYLFQGLIKEITPQVCRSKILDVFTVHKSELIFEILNDDQKKQLILNIDQRFPFVSLNEAANFKSPQFSVFGDLKNAIIENIKIIPYNKYVIIILNEFSVHASFYGQEPNIVLFDNEEKFIDAFKSHKNGKLIEKPQSEKISLTEQLVAKLKESKPNSTLIDLFTAILPGFNYNMYDELCYRLQVVGDEKLKNINPTEIYKTADEFLKELESGNAYIYRKQSKKTLTLFKSRIKIDDHYEMESFDSINKAWRLFIREHKNHSEFERLFNKLSAALKKRHKKLETALANITEAENFEQRKQEADLKGNLILTNKHKIPRNSSSVDLVNVFSDEQETITIKLNPKKTSVENAQNYFDKYKNMTEKKQIVRIKKENYARELEEISILLNKLENSHLKDLQKIKEQMIDMKIIQSDSISKKSADSLKYAFKRLIFENKWDIYIGKNAENNDLLTFTFANKWDLWLHAQGVPGSHVIIKAPGKDTTVPQHVIEQAAQIAAANSNAKHSATVPVIYTNVRHVTRIRKAPPGTVATRNEKVIFVKPLNLNM